MKLLKSLSIHTIHSCNKATLDLVGLNSALSFMAAFILVLGICGMYCVSTKKIKTRMKTSKSSEALSRLGAEKIAFPPKPDGHIQTDIRTDFSIYRVASILKKKMLF